MKSSENFRNTFILICAMTISVITQLHAQAVTLRWANQAGASSYDNGTSVATDASGNVYTTGVFAGTVDFDPGPGISTLTSDGSLYDIFISKSDSAGNLIWVKQMGGPSFEASTAISLDASG
ncbi:MAG TPA: SBBP repeat-containing protein, partial [Bacteroidia bacterium]|nr:SBBP repeat-containing protein [Bacteroidia bacterium]